MFGSLVPFQLWIQKLAMPSSWTVHGAPLFSLGQMPAKGFLLDLPGLSSPSFSPVPNYFCAVFQINTGNASEVCGLSKFHCYIPFLVCQADKILNKTSPGSVLDEFCNRIVNQISFQHNHRMKMKGMTISAGYLSSQRIRIFYCKKNTTIFNMTSSVF